MIFSIEFDELEQLNEKQIHELEDRMAIVAKYYLKENSRNCVDLESVTVACEAE